jgi:hypothetical protein
MAEYERPPASSSSTVTETRSSGGNGFLYFAIGALIVAVGVLGWMFYDGSWRQDRTADTAIERTADAIGDAADDIGDSAREAARNVQPAPAPQPAQPAPATPPAEPSNPG